MRRSKLEMYVDILNVLAQRGPLNLMHINYEVTVNCEDLKEHVNFLMNQGLIEERGVGNDRGVFAITDRGTSVLKFFGELNKVLTFIEDGKILNIPVEKTGF